MGVLAEPLRRLSEYLEIEKCIKEGRYPVGITGCVDSQKGHLVANLGEKASCRLVVTWKEEKAREMYEDLSFFDRNTMHYPSKDILFYSADVHSNHTTTKRMKVLKRLASGEPLTIVLCVDVLMEKMMPPESFRENVLTIRLDSTVNTDELRKTLVEMGYQSSGLVEGPGEFSVRGDIVDIFPLTEDSPVRIELWGDEIDSMRSFDVESQRSIENLEEIRIYPASEIILRQERMPEAIRRMREEYDHQAGIFKNAKKRQEKERLRKMVEATEDELSSLGTAAGSETLLSYFYEKTASFLDYLPEDTMVFIDEPHRVEEKGRTSEQEFSLSMQSRLEGGYVLPSQADLMYGCEEMVFHLLKRPAIFLSGMIQEYALFKPAVSVNIEAKSIYSYNNSFDQLIKDLQHWSREKYQIMLMSSSATRARRLAEDIRDEGLLAYFAEDYGREIHPGEVMVTCGRLNSGFEYPSIKFVVLSEKDIFKERRQKSRKKKSQYSGQKIRSLADISIGDYVVHEKYGLGIYRGMEQIETDGVAKDYINVEYKEFIFSLLIYTVFLAVLKHFIYRLFCLTIF